MLKKFPALFVVLMAICFNCVAQDNGYPSLQIFKKLHPYDTDLFRVWTRIHELTTDFEITRPSHMTAIGHINVQHRKIYICGKSNYAVGYALKLTIKNSDTQSGLGPVNQDLDLNEDNMYGRQLIVGSITGDNIDGASDHYSLGAFEGYEKMDEPGWYRVEVWGNSHSDVCGTSIDGLIEVVPSEGITTYNQLIVRVEDQ